MQVANWFSTLPLLAAEAAGESKSIPDQLGINLTGLIFQAVGFGILLFVLWRFAYNPLLKIIDDRRDRAQEILDKSEQIKKELSETSTRNKEELDKARTEAQAIIAQARATQERIVTEAVDKAKNEATAELERAKTQIRAERDQAFAQLRRETADIAIDAATKVIGRELSINKEAQSQIINDVLANAKNN